MLRTGSIFILFFVSFSLLNEIFPQVPDQIQKYRAEPYGEFKYEKESILDGNLIRTLFKNTGEIGHWPFQPSGEWPKGSGHPYLDGMTLLIGAEVTAPGNQAVIHPIESSYREQMDYDPLTGEIWGLEPIPGYSNPSSTKPAMSIDRNSWPSIWPNALGLGAEWNGRWYGYWGRDVKTASFENFFVMDDSQDKEFTRSPYNFFPVLSDTNRGGLGLRVEVRGYQCSKMSYPLADNILFWHYDIVNISDFSYDSTCIGFYFDSGVGGTNDNGDNVRYDKDLEIIYAYDTDGLGTPGNWVTGYIGVMLLETPSNSVNGIDDDGDGMIDERRDDGIDNDRDWVGYLDVNNNGKWDSPIEPLNDDVGKDGVGVYDNLDYFGPDDGEGDGIPTDGEPNFDKTDNDESDQIGVTAVSLNYVSQTSSSLWPKNDDVVWSKMVGGFADTVITNANVSALFSSGPFPLQKFSRERISSAIICADNVEKLTNTATFARNLYNNDYDFTTVGIDDEDLVLANTFSLSQNYPNPFNPVTKIQFSVPQNEVVKIKVYDFLGAEITTLVNREMYSGSYEVDFNGKTLASGIYFVRMEAGKFVETKKIVLLK